MKRPLVIFSIALMAGISIAFASKSYIFIFLSILSIVLSVAALCHFKRNLQFIAMGVLLFYSAGAFGFLYFHESNARKFVEYLGKEVVVRGVVDSESDVKLPRVTYVVKTLEVKADGVIKPVKGKVLLSTLIDSEQTVYDYGKILEISGQLEMPKGVRNPGGFDYRRYLAQSGISATLFARQESIKPGGRTGVNWFVTAGLSLKYRIVQVINQSLPEQQAGLLNGMLIGYREGLSKEVESAFSDAGLSHIMAVSGANVAFIIFPFVLLFKKLRINQKVSNSIIIGILLLFVFIVGFSPSVLRAVVMAVVILLGQMLRRETDVFTSLAFAAIVLLFYNPYSLFDIGFQLSFAATLSLVLFYKNIRQMLDFKFIPKVVSDTLAVTLAAQVGVVPIVVYYFNKISIISVVSNLIVVPVVEGITMLGAAMAILGQFHVFLSQLIGFVNCSLLSFVLLVTKVSSELPFAVIQVVTPSIPVLIVYYFVVLFLFWYKPLTNFKLELKHYKYAISAIVLIYFVNLLIPRNLEVVFIDVGQGDSALIKTTSGKTVLIDGGGHSSKLGGDQNSIGETTLTPFLLDYGVSKLDFVIATHGHEDHTQGLESVLKSFKVNRLIIPSTDEKGEIQKLINLAGARNIPVEAYLKGQNIRIDSKSFFEVLNPSKEIPENKSPLNNSSLMLKLNYKNTKILFTGDCEAEVEAVLLAENADVEADILKVGHHGSNTSTGAEFLAKVNPSAAIICVGRNNFGHPSKSTLKKLEEKAVKLFRTDRDGAVVVNTDGKKIKIRETVHGQ